ncbi:MAG: 3-dehydroquinate dehydratase [Bacteroidia bacterium]|nr:3-dehydroquinate dehydratase [Bacteroidia bacterium]
MKIIIINGPNLNLLGKREPSVYGDLSFETYFSRLKDEFPDYGLEYFQSNVEGELINCLHRAGSGYTGIILNAGGYTHTSVSISDAIAAVDTPVIEVHITNTASREEYRHTSLLTKNCIGVIGGFGLDSYRLAIVAFSKLKA